MHIMEENAWFNRKAELLQRNLPSQARQKMRRWIDIKDDLLDRLSEYKAIKKIGNEEALIEKQELVAELDELETENNQLLSRLQDLQNDLVRRRGKARKLFDQLGGVKNDYLQCLSEENSLVSEISFMEKEKSRLADELWEKRQHFDDNMIALNKLVDEIKFVKGETETWVGKLISLESEVPGQYRELAFLNNKIDRARKSITGLGDKLKSMERNVKTSYYRYREK